MIPEERREDRPKSLDEWQIRWNAVTKELWTQRLIENVQSWVEGRHCDVDFYMTQFLTGHGCFREYLRKYGHDNEVNCSFCNNGNENAEHILFYCRRLRLLCELLEAMTNERVTPGNIVSHILRSAKVM